MRMKTKTFIAVIAMVCAAFSACSDKDNNISPTIHNPTPKEQWGPTAKGADFTVPQLPDLFVNYWEYSYSVEDNANLALKISGQFPSCRYFSFSTYNDENGEVISGMSDFEMVPDDGCVNPFVQTSKAKNTFTVYIVPATTTDAQISKLPSQNIIRLGAGIRKACLIIREYLGIDEFGGVELPAIQAYDMTTMQEVPAPLRGTSNMWRDPAPFQPQWFDAETDVPFMLAPRGSFYPNNATDYLYCRTAIEDNQVMTWSFIPAPYPKKVEDYKSAPCRYWSMCFGTQLDTRSYYSVYDEQANVPDGEKVTFVLCLKQNPRLTEIEAYVAKAKAAGQYINLIVWDRERPSYFGPETPIGNCITVMYRNILPNKEWEHSMSNMTPTPYGDPVTSARKDPEHMQAHLALGEYGPRGTKVSTEEFLK